MRLALQCTPPTTPPITCAALSMAHRAASPTALRRAAQETLAHHLDTSRHATLATTLHAALGLVHATPSHRWPPASAAPASAVAQYCASTRWSPPVAQSSSLARYRRARRSHCRMPALVNRYRQRGSPVGQTRSPTAQPALQDAPTHAAPPAHRLRSTCVPPSSAARGRTATPARPSARDQRARSLPAAQ